MGEKQELFNKFKVPLEIHWTCEETHIVLARLIDQEQICRIDQSLERTGSFDQRLNNLEEQLVQASEQIDAAAGTTNNMKDLETAITALQYLNDLGELHVN
ncbi:hypothetical protein VP01_834g1 [Puccinia sorghi]|uniref:Uncharacterized protein n=1 Tax=Puccinia sorghi TaxID=27349 RepID=A0A0L6U9J7_9BASI|nr:hypothetical protein VP01_834g1 [Puccinia sorghi]